MSTVLTIAVVGTLNIVCFFIGAKIGQTIVKGEKVAAPTIAPKKIKQSRQIKKAAQLEQEQYNAIMQNIDNYDGTGIGQIDVPRI